MADERDDLLLLARATQLGASIRKTSEPHIRIMGDDGPVFLMLALEAELETLRYAFERSAPPHVKARLEKLQALRADVRRTAHEDSTAIGEVKRG